MVLRSLIASVVVVALLVIPAAAQEVPRVVAFSGTADGNSPPSKPVAITIAIYDDASSSTPLFLETHTVQLLQNRRFEVLLGSATPGGLPEALFANNAARWIGVKVASLAEQTPRIMMVSVPYGLKAADSDKLGGLPASEYLTEIDPSEANAYTDQKVAEEAAARSAADTTLQSNIDAEAAARAQGDIDTLGAANAYTDSKVAAEAATRAAADTTLQSNINGLTAAAITSLIADGGISISGSGNSRIITNTGDTNTADDITSLNGGAGISISGSGNSRTITNAGDINAFDDITSLIAGNGISILGAGNSRTVAGNTLTLNGATFGNGGSGVFTFNSSGPIPGTATPARVLTFPADPGGGAGDNAYIAYYPRVGESTVLEISVKNDPDDGIALMSSGGVGIGTLTPLDPLQVIGDIRVGTGDGNGCVRRFDGTAIAGTCSSDERLKTNIRPFPALLDKVTKLQPTYFNWKSEQAPALHLSGESFGLIAQDVEKVLPELVQDNNREGYKAVHYEMLPMMMLQAMRELKQENDALKAALADQAARLQAIEAALKK